MDIDFSFIKLADLFRTQAFAALGGGVLGAFVGRARTLGPKINELETTGTFSLVALGACTYGQIANSVPPTIMPIVSGTCMGVGFLAGSLITRDSESLEGTTSAALIWTVASAGLAVGCSIYELATVDLIYLSFIVWLHEHDYPDFRLLGIMKRKRRSPRAASKKVDD